MVLYSSHDLNNGQKVRYSGHGVPGNWITDFIINTKLFNVTCLPLFTSPIVWPKTHKGKKEKRKKTRQKEGTKEKHERKEKE